MSDEIGKFDSYAREYERVLNASVGMFGESGRYFSEAKAGFIADRLGRSFRGTVLDYGCGIGLLSGCLQESLGGAVVHGYDPSVESIANVFPPTRDRGMFTADLNQLSNAYDCIVVANVLHHVPVSERSTLVQNLVYRLAARGTLFIFEHNPLNPLTRWSVSHCEFDDDAVLLHPRETRGYLQKARAEKVWSGYFMFFPSFAKRLRGLENYLRWCPAGAQYVVTGRRIVV